MAKAKAKGKPRPPKKVPFGGYAVCFKGCTDTLESLFGSAPDAAVRHDEAALGVREAAPPRDEGVRPARTPGWRAADHQRRLAALRWRGG